MPIAVSAPASPAPAHDASTPLKPATIGVTQQMVQSREDSVYLAKLAEQAERYEGMSFPFLSTFIHGGNLLQTTADMY